MIKEVQELSQLILTLNQLQRIGKWTCIQLKIEYKSL